MTPDDILRHLRERDAQRHIPGGYELANALVDYNVLAEIMRRLERPDVQGIPAARSSRTAARSEQLEMML